MLVEEGLAVLVKPQNLDAVVELLQVGDHFFIDFKFHDSLKPAGAFYHFPVAGRTERALEITRARGIDVQYERRLQRQHVLEQCSIFAVDPWFNFSLHAGVPFVPV